MGLYWCCLLGSGWLVLFGFWVSCWCWFHGCGVLFHVIVLFLFAWFDLGVNSVALFLLLLDMLCFFSDGFGGGFT